MNTPLLSKRSILLMFASILIASVLARSADSDADVKFLADKAQRFAAHQQDFADFMKSQVNESNNLEYIILKDLSDIASTNSERIDSIKTLVEIYKESTCKSDQLMVRVHLRYQLEQDLGLIDIDVKAVNADLSHTKLPAVSQTAINMKEDLREVRSRFEAIKAQ